MGLYWLLAYSPLYRVKEIIVKGNQEVPRDELVQWANLAPGNNIFRVDIGRVVARLNRHPWVKGVIVERVLPDKLVVTIMERVPYACLTGLPSTYLLDEEGVILQEITEEKGRHKTLPELVGFGITAYLPGQKPINTQLLRGLEVLHLARQCPWALRFGILRVKLSPKEGPVVWLNHQKIRIRFGGTDPKVAWPRLQTVSSHLASEWDRIEQVDLSFEAQVVIQYY